MTVGFEAYALFLEELTLLEPSWNSAPDTIDNTVARIDCGGSTEHMANKTSMTGSIDEIGNLTVAHYLTTGNSGNDTIDGIAESGCGWDVRTFKH